jgi:hypothetical protein
VNDALEEALLHIWRQVWLPLKRRAEDVMGGVADVLPPSPAMYLCPLDGGTVTGVVVLQKGQAVAFLGTRHPASTSGRQPFPHSDVDDVPWGRHVDPYRRS